MINGRLWDTFGRQKSQQRKVRLHGYCLATAKTIVYCICIQINDQWLSCSWIQNYKYKYGCFVFIWFGPIGHASYNVARHTGMSKYVFHISFAYCLDLFCHITKQIIYFKYKSSTVLYTSLSLSLSLSLRNHSVN